VRRDRPAELAWLEDLAARARHNGLEHPEPGAFTSGVVARLDQGGEHLIPRPAHRYVRELEEEALDLAGWALIALEAHPRAPARLRSELRAVALLGLAAHAHLHALEVDGR
jgi:hypothetical protein